MTLLEDTFVLAGAGVCGGSLVYANTLYEPPDTFFADGQWAQIADWKAELAAHFDQAKRTLGVTVNPTITPADRVIAEVAQNMGIADTYQRTLVGVFFGGPGRQPGEDVPDPFFGGAGPDRRACTHCGECMTGCRHNAKNIGEELPLSGRAGRRHRASADNGDRCPPAAGRRLPGHHGPHRPADTQAPASIHRRADRVRRR